MFKKKNTLYTILFLSWAGICLYFDPRLFSPAYFQTNIVAQSAIVIFIICVNLFWFYGLYHLLFSVFSYAMPKKSYTLPQPFHPHPKVAILYTTSNDFQSEALDSCLKQNYDYFDVYVLDDSTDDKFIGLLDAFAAKNPLVKIIRRRDKIGYKAGNLNSALKELHPNYQYFAVCDADTILPLDFISRLLPYFQLGEKIGFIQANQKANPVQRSRFASILSFNTDLHWRHYVPVKEGYGFTMFYGHGALISTAAWIAAGGFPEIATEDLAFSSVLKEKGYSGVFASEVCCYEDFPLTYQSLRKRNKRWTTGTLEYLDKYFPSMLKNKGISWVEKADVFFSAISLLLSFPFLVYILIAGLVLPYSQEIFKHNIPVYLVNPTYFNGFFDFLAKLKYKIYWTSDFFVIMLVAIFAQMLPVFIDLFKKPKRMLEYINLFTYLSASLVLASSIDLLEYLFTKKALFSVTGDFSQNEGKNSRFLLTAEILFGILLLYYALPPVIYGYL